MNRLFALFAALSLLVPLASVFGQAPPPPVAPTPPAVETPTRIEARREVIIHWTLGEQAWNFNDVLAAYRPVNGYLGPRPSQGNLAVWRLRLTKDFEQGTIRLHEEMRGSPFKIVLLDADRTEINPVDIPAQITPISGKMDDTIELLVGLPDAQVLRDVKMIRVQRRTNVGF